MKYTKLGNTNIKVSRICLGCMSFGVPSKDFLEWTLDYETSKSIIKKALDLGINFFDTANSYSNGTSEEYLGKALKELGVNRKDVVIATKVFFNEGKLSKEAIFRECNASLKRLGTDYIDLYQIHRFDYDHPIQETMEALNELVKLGKVKAIGASAMLSNQFIQMQEVAKSNNWATFSTMQNHYNLLYREDEKDMIPVCNKYNVTLIPYSPLASGHLSRSSWDSLSKRSKTDKNMKNKYEHAKESDMNIVKAVEEIAKKYNASMTQIALAWLLHKGVNPILGTSKISHLDDAIKAFDINLTNEDIKKLEEYYVPHKLVGPLIKS